MSAQLNSDRSSFQGGLLTINQHSLLVHPAFRILIAPLQDEMITLQPARQIIPRRGNHRVLALEILDHLVCLGLNPWFRILYTARSHRRWISDMEMAGKRQIVEDSSYLQSMTTHEYSSRFGAVLYDTL